MQWAGILILILVVHMPSFAALVATSGTTTMNSLMYEMRNWQKNKDPDTLPKFDNVNITAVATCPTFGIMRYEHHKVYASNRRAMALEAGLAAHEAFASVRLGDLYFN